MSAFMLSLIVIVYLAIIAYLGYLGYKGTKSVSDYMVGGRSIHPYIMAISYGATFISTSAIVGFGGVASIFGLSLLWLTFLNIFVGILIAFIFFGKRTRQMGHNLNAHTFPELLGERFQSKFLQGSAGILIFVGMPLYAGVVLIGASHFIAQTLNINYEAALFFFTTIIALYVIMGGLKGVMYTDAFQGSLMFIGMLFLLIFTYSKLGGVTQAHKSLEALAPEAVKIFGKAGHQGWTKFPVLGSVFWWQLVSTLILGVGIGVLAQPQLVVRFMTVETNKELNRAVLVGGIFILMMTGVAFVVGALSNVYFYNHPDFGKISLLAADKNVGKIIPLYINSAMPKWFTALFLVTLLSAAMSTLSSQFHTMGTSLGRDFYEKALGKKGKSVIITKIGILITIIVSLFLAYGLPKWFPKGTEVIARGTAIFFGLCAAAFLPIYIGALYSKRITRAGALAGFWSGTITSAFWLFFVHIKESKALGLSKAIFGVDSLAIGTKFVYVDPILIALPIAIIFTIAVSYFTQPPSEKHLKKCFNKVA